MSRIMVDAANPADIPKALAFDIIAGYRTGTPGTWWDTHWDDFPGKTMVVIDQAAQPNAPYYAANVMDVEPYCYHPSDIPGWVSHCTAPRPTVYCDRNDYPEVRKVWNGDIWLAAPGVKISPYPDDHRIVAIQTVFNNTYDVSIVFDDTWPYLATPTTGETDMIHGMIEPGAREFIAFPEGSFKRVMLYHDFTSAGEQVRVACNSYSKGYSQIVTPVVNSSAPVSVQFSEPDVNAVSLVNKSTVPMGWTVAAS